MTYRNKLLLKRLLIVLLIAAAVIFVLLLLGYTYLGRYVIYTENGAYFSFHSQMPAETSARAAAVPSSIELVTGEPIAANQVLGDNSIVLSDREIRGVLVDYETLSQGTELDKVDLSNEDTNTLVLEMRIADQPMLSSIPIQRLIDRAKNQDTWLVAIISCLAQSNYAAAHPEMALQIDGGILFEARKGTNFLDPANAATITYVAELIRQLSEMGFNEVVLDDFYMPTSQYLKYDFGGKTDIQIFEEAYQNVLDATSDFCKVSLMVMDPSLDQQGMNTVERIYVCYNDGASVRAFAEAHASQYLVFLTDSHDTRFDEYGKVETSSEFIFNRTGKTELSVSVTEQDADGEASSDDEEDEED